MKTVQCLIVLAITAYSTAQFYPPSSPAVKISTPEVHDAVQYDHNYLQLEAVNWNWNNAYQRMQHQPWQYQTPHTPSLSIHETVQVRVYYESLCPDCRTFDTDQLVPLLKKLPGYIDVHTFPYGNAETHVKDGQYVFECQHGPPECYGNKLHACVIDALRNNTAAVFVNACLMDNTQAGQGSDDRALDVCGQAMGLNTASIKQCAKGPRGIQLLKFFGDESKKIKYNSVPHILVNGVLSDENNLMRDVCRAFKNPPEACACVTRLI